MQVADGASHTLLLRSDGHVDRCGYNGQGQCDVPEISRVDVTYARVAAGPFVYVLGAPRTSFCACLLG